MLRRIVDQQRAARVAEMKARYIDRIERIQRAVDPPLSNGELALACELPVTAIGRYKSQSPRSKSAVPDRFTRALLDHLCAGDSALAVRAPETIGGRREVLICALQEALRLGGDWDLYNVAGKPIVAPRRAADWEEDGVWDLFDEAPEAPPARGPCLPWRRLGPASDPLWLSPLGLGGMRLSTQGRPERAQAIDILHAAWDGGLTWVDTANVYAQDETDIGHNEALIAEALRSWEGPPIPIATKGGLTRKGTRWLPNGKPESLIAACEASLRALGRERIDLYQLHAVDGRVPFAEQVEALKTLRDRGLIRHIGLCNVTAAQLAEAQSIAPIVSVQNALSPLDQKALDVVEACRAAGIAFIAHSPLGGWRRAERLRTAKAFRTVGDRHGVGPHAIALAWLLEFGPHVFAIPGASRIESVQANAEALTVRLTGSDLATLAGAVPTGPAAPAEDPGDVVVIMGTPAAGKTSRVDPFVHRGYHRLNRDELGGSLDGMVPRLEKAASGGTRRFVLDNTYGTRKSRKRLLAACATHDLPVRCVWLDVPEMAAAFHAARRMISRHEKMLSPAEIKADDAANMFPPAALRRYAQSFETPELDEGFDHIEHVPYVRRLGPEYVNKALILDYDGTLRVTRSGEIYPRDPDDVQALPFRTEVLQRYREQGYRLLGLSNQSGVASKRLSHETAQACIDRTNELLGIDIEAVFCPHPAGKYPSCYCRKPMPGYGVYFIEKYKLDPAQCIMVGDMDSDRGFAEAAGFQFVHADEFFEGGDA
jgi:HAD superfamily hydrolase (TIGR01662 family)